MTRRAYAKINIFLKITGTRGAYHEILSRFVLIDDLYDTLTLLPHAGERFEVAGEFGCPPEETTLMKAYRAMIRHLNDPRIAEFCRGQRLTVDKRIPSCAGLGGGSSDAAAFILMIVDALGLAVDPATLRQIGLDVGADVPFFLSGLRSANVSGIGEVIVPFDDDIPLLALMTPPVSCPTPAVYRAFRENLLETIDPAAAATLATMTSREILQRFSPAELNDLYRAARIAVPELAAYGGEGRFFSGSGSTFFSLKEF